MNRSDFDQFKAAMAMLGETFGKEISQLLLDAYWLALQDIGLPEFEAAALKLLRDSRFMPRPAEFRAAIVPKTTWVAAWTELLEHHGRTGDPIGQAALRALGGWAVVGYVDQSKLSYFQNRFEAAYETLAESAAQALPALDGPSPSTGGGSAGRVALALLEALEHDRPRQ